ncbi:MAG: UDP-3-O-(3-hydroxymyristoyl)glucosamine N-acyltransferase, partial [Halomonas sp.]
MTHASHHLTLADIARHLGVAFKGNAEQPIRGLATLKEAQPDQVAFLANRAYLKDLATTQAAAVLLHPEHGKDCPVPRLEIDNPYLGYAKLSQLFDPLPARDVIGIHPTAVVADDVQLGADVSIQAHAVVEAGVVLGSRVVIGAGSMVGADSQLGEGTRLHANVTVCHGVVIGKNVILQSGCVIGGDGFGFAHDGAGWHKIVQLGGVVLGDDVEVGSCSSI